MHSKLLFSIGILIFGCFLVVEAKKKKLTKPRLTCAYSTCVQNHGKSGKFKVYNKNNESNALTVLFDAIKEVDADGKQVGKSGGVDGKHSFNTFAPLDFEFTDIKNETYKDVEAAMFTFSANIPGPNATLTVDMYFFNGNGTGDVCDEEEFPIAPGMVKFNIKIENWNFCSKENVCKKGNKEDYGKYIDFTITVQKKGKAVKGGKGKKGKGKKKKGKGNRNEAQKFMFGNSTIEFPSYFQMDGGNCSQMPNDYPMMTSKGDKNSITFRFPRFNNMVFYDPTIDESGKASISGGSEGGNTTTPKPTTTDNGSQTSAPTTTDTGSQSLAPMVLVTILAVFARILF